MKRGLVVLDHEEVSEAEWAGRAEAVRALMAAEGVDIALVYGDVFRSDDIHYLTNLCLYWNESILVIPADGGAADMTLLTKLSPRVHTWMRRTTTLTDLRSGKTFEALLKDLLEGRTPGTIGLIDAPLWAASVVEEVSAAAPGWTVRPLGGLVRELRARPSEAELALLRRAGAVLDEAAGAAIADGLPDGERIAVAERIVRDAGFTDVLVRAENGAVEITGQHRTSWLRAGRDQAGDAGKALRSAVALAADGVTVGRLADAVKPWDVRVIDHVDLSTNGEYADSSPEKVLTAGEVVVISVEGPEKTGASDTVLISPAGAENLTDREVLS
jgi:hypothetical protein